MRCWEAAAAMAQRGAELVPVPGHGFKRSIEPEPALKDSSTEFWKTGGDVVTSYWEIRPDEGKVLWESLPHTGYERRNGKEVVASGFYEFFGFKTSEPRISQKGGRDVVLRKRMDDWREIDGHKVKKTDLDIHDGGDEAYRQLYFASMLLGDTFRLGTYGNSQFGKGFCLNDFPYAFGNGDRGFVEFTAERDPSKILRSVPTDWLPLDHPWRSLGAEDIHKFQQRLRELKDSDIKHIVSLGKLSPADSQSLFQAIKARRDVLLAQLNPHNVPEHPTHDLLEAKAHGQKEDAPWRGDERNQFFAARVPLIPNHQKLLEAFINGKDANVRTVSNSFDFLENMESLGHTQIPLETKRLLMERILSLSQREGSRPDMDRLHSFGGSVISSLLVGSRSTNETAAVATRILKAHYETDPQNLQSILKGLWHFPDDASSSFGNFRPYAEALHAMGQDEAVEILNMSFLASALDAAESSDAQLSKGMGFHNAVHVRACMQRAARAMHDMANLGIHRTSLTNNLDMPTLVRIANAMQYDNGGRRQLGQNISPTEAFGLGGDRRTETYNVYDLVRAYIMGRSNTLPEVLLRQLGNGT
jgi:hypothetical protein